MRRERVRHQEPAVVVEHHDVLLGERGEVPVLARRAGLRERLEDRPPQLQIAVGWGHAIRDITVPDRLHARRTPHGR